MFTVSHSTDGVKVSSVILIMASLPGPGFQIQAVYARRTAPDLDWAPPIPSRGERLRIVGLELGVSGLKSRSEFLGGDLSSRISIGIKGLGSGALAGREYVGGRSRERGKSSSLANPSARLSKLQRFNPQPIFHRRSFSHSPVQPVTMEDSSYILCM